MGIFNSYQKEGKGVDKVDRRPRIIIFFDIYFRKFWNLILANLLYILFCLPIVTIGPATAGLTKILRNYAREEHAFLWGDFWETFKKNFWRALLVGVLDLLVGLIIYYDAWYFSNFTAPGIPTIIALAVVMLSATIYIFMRYYIYVLLITFRLTLKQLFKNSFKFAWIGLFRNILTTIIVGVITFFVLSYITSPIVLIFVFLLYFTTCGLIINFIVYPLIKKYMIDNVDPLTGQRLEPEIQDEQDNKKQAKE